MVPLGRITFSTGMREDGSICLCGTLQGLLEYPRHARSRGERAKGNKGTS